MTRLFDSLPNEVAQALHDVLAWHEHKRNGRSICAEHQLRLLDDSAQVLRRWIERQDPGARRTGAGKSPDSGVRFGSYGGLHLVRDVADPPKKRGR